MAEKLYIPGLIDERPNPIAVLGLTAEAARALGGENIKNVTSALFRAQVMALHPDTLGRVPKAAEKDRAIELAAAHDRMRSEDPVDLLKSYLTSKTTQRRHAKKTEAEPFSSSGFGGSSQPRNNILSTAHYRHSQLAEALFDGQHSPNAAANLAAFDLVLSNDHNPFNDSADKSFKRLSYDASGLYSQPLTTSTRPLSATLGALYPRHINKTDPTEIEFLRKHGGDVQKYSGGLVLDAVAGENIATRLKDGWHSIRGVQTVSRDNRSVQSYTAAGDAEHLQDYLPSGSISPEAWRAIVDQTIKPLVRNRRDVLESGRDTSQESYGRRSFEEIHMAIEISTLATTLTDKYSPRKYSASLVPNWIMLASRRIDSEHVNHQVQPIGVIQFGSQIPR